LDGDDPDKFRASSSCRSRSENTTTAYNTYFADQVGGKTIGFGYTYSTSTNSSRRSRTQQPEPGADFYLGSTTNGCDYYLNNQANAAAPRRR